jgi:hypothetical protein
MNNISGLSKEIAKAAKTVAMQWPTVVEQDDLQQDIYTHLLERPNVIEKLLTEFDDKNRLNAIIDLGHQIAKQERIDYEVFSGNFRYSVNEVKKLLEKQTFKDASLSRTSTSGDLLEGMRRLREATPQYAEAIEKRYVNGESPATDADRKRSERALEALATEMNRSFKSTKHDDGPGSRKPVTATAAHYRSKSNWDDQSSEAVERLQRQARVSGR